MDLTKTITYNSFSITGVTRSAGVPAYGCQVEEASFSDAEVAGYTDKASLRDGLDAADVYLGRRILHIRASVFGSSQGDGYDRLQDFLAAFSPRLAYRADSANAGFLAFTFFQPTADISTWATSAYPSGIPLQFYARPAALPTWRVSRDASGGAAGNGIAFDVSVPLLMRDPRKYLQTAVSLSVTTATQTATYRGDYPAWPSISITKGTAAGSSTFKVVLSGKTSIIDLSTASGPTYILDYERRWFYLTSTGASRMQWATAIEGDEVGPSSFTVSMANATNITSCTLTYREAWA